MTTRSIKKTKPVTPKPKRPRGKPATSARAVKPKRAVRRPKPAVTAAPRRITRRAVFVDVENTSSESDLLRVLDALKIDRAAQPTEVTAAGNWKSVGQRLARRLAGLGAQLVHSAPAIGVRDWSDLWIAVAAGCWLGRAEAGDQLDIVSDDRAFDAVGDAAAARGVAFRRISYRTSPAVAAAEPAAEPTPRRRSHRGGRRRGSGETPTRVHPAPTPAVAHSAKPAALPEAHEGAHGASHEQILAVVGRLTGGNPDRWVNLDVLANTLKAEGFTRPAGSPRLVTRLRKLKDLDVSPNGMVRLLERSLIRADADLEASEDIAPAVRKRSRRRGGRGRRRTDQPAAAATSEAVGLSGAGNQDPV